MTLTGGDDGGGDSGRGCAIDGDVELCSAALATSAAAKRKWIRMALEVELERELDFTARACSQDAAEVRIRHSSADGGFRGVVVQTRYNREADGPRDRPSAHLLPVSVLA